MGYVSSTSVTGMTVRARVLPYGYPASSHPTERQASLIPACTGTVLIPAFRRAALRIASFSPLHDSEFPMICLAQERRLFAVDGVSIRSPTNTTTTPVHCRQHRAFWDTDCLDKTA